MPLGTQSHSSESFGVVLTSGDQRASMACRASVLMAPANGRSHVNRNLPWRAFGAFRDAGEDGLGIALRSTACIEPTDGRTMAIDRHL